MTIREILVKYPFMEEFFLTNGIPYKIGLDISLHAMLEKLTEEEKEDIGLPLQKIEENFNIYLEQMLEFLGVEKTFSDLTILPGQNKRGEKENFTKLVVKPSEVIAIVGPTGSGKSRLLADIEWLARKDTPTKRQILINGQEVATDKRFFGAEKIVAQLSQNMNFIMDLTVAEYIDLHAKSRLIDPDTKRADIIADANSLSGEGFQLDTYITALSGGQSRALMISDTANLSKSPIVLIDEIENAGIDRIKAVKLLIKREKIVFMATHDPMLALMADKRIVIQHGGISKIILTSEEERKQLKKLQEMDFYIGELRTKLRYGQTL